MSTDVIDRYARGTKTRWGAIRRDLPGYLVPFGRALFASVFLLSALGHFSNETFAYAASRGVPLANVVVPFAGFLAFFGGMSVAIGYQTRIGAWLLVLYLVPVTFVMHRYWAIADDAAATTERAHFLKNISMLGGALLLAYFGAGPFSLDAARKGPTTTTHGAHPPRQGSSP